MSAWMDGWMDGWSDGWMNGWMDGWMDICLRGWMASTHTELWSPVVQAAMSSVHRGLEPPTRVDARTRQY